MTKMHVLLANMSSEVVLERVLLAHVVQTEGSYSQLVT